jgi:hypothetical protein
MYNLTQTTGNQSSQGRVGPPTTSVLASLRRYVGATSLRLDHAPTREAKRAIQKTSVQRCVEGAGQRACTVPTSATTAVICLRSTELFYHTARKTETQPPLPPSEGTALSSRPMNGDGTSRAALLRVSAG